jgi:predicted nucleotidyltransferase
MSRAEIIRIIESNLAHLKSLGVKSLDLFGSAARDEVRPDSDVDVLIEVEGRSTFDAFMDVKEFLESVLGRRVDLVTRGALKPLVTTNIERDLIRVA